MRYSGKPDLCRPLPLTSLSYLQTGRRESSVQSEVSVSVTCPWRTDPGWRLCSCRGNLEVRPWESRASPRGRSRRPAPRILRLLRSHPPPPLLPPPSRPGWCLAWQHQSAPADGGNNRAWSRHQRSPVRRYALKSSANNSHIRVMRSWGRGMVPARSSLRLISGDGDSKTLFLQVFLRARATCLQPSEQ